MVPSPLELAETRGQGMPSYVPVDARVLANVELRLGTDIDVTRSFERAGPRAKIFFDPKKTRAGIVTSGGLCPGINNVIRSIVLQCFHKYGVKSVLGFRFGFAGLAPDTTSEPLVLDPEAVLHVHGRGGTMLGTSRGKQDVGAMVDTLEKRGVDILFAIGGDGTMRGAHAIAEEVRRRGKQIAIVGVPKTIDNDIAWVDKTFGFETAVSTARLAIDAANTEAMSVKNGIGLVKLMGREAGFIAAHATISSHDVNVCLVPEIPFEIDRLLSWLEKRLADRGHAVIVVGEGCGTRLMRSDAPRDASGNLSFKSDKLDIGPHLKHRIEEHLRDKKVPYVLKYVDPSYMIRGVPANAIDAVFCDELARYAVHAAMAGKTDVLVGRWHRSFTHVPLPLALATKKRLDPDSDLWLAVLETTGQPRFVG